MIIVETASFQLGAYTVQQRPRPDNPAFAVFVVMKAAKIIGRQFSRPSEDDCKWLERERQEQARIANRVGIVEGGFSVVQKRLLGGLANGDGSKRYVPTGRKRGRPRKDEPRQELEAALQS